MGVLVDGDEEVAGGVWRLGRAEEEMSARTQREMESLDDAVLNAPIEIDQQVPA
jgi:hypothetical protein